MTPVKLDLYGSLTQLTNTPQPQMELAVSMLQALAKAVCRARRNKQQILRFTKRARELCDQLNDQAALEKDEAASAVFEAKLQSLEQCLFDVLNIVQSEWDPLSAKSLAKWPENSLVIGRSLDTLYSGNFAPEGDDVNRVLRIQDQLAARTCDGLQWIGSIWTAIMKFLLGETIQKPGVAAVVAKLDDLRNTLSTLAEERFQAAVDLVVRCATAVWTILDRGLFRNALAGDLLNKGAGLMDQLSGLLTKPEIPLNDILSRWKVFEDLFKNLSPLSPRSGDSEFFKKIDIGKLSLSPKSPSGESAK